MINNLKQVTVTLSYRAALELEAGATGYYGTYVRATEPT